MGENFCCMVNTNYKSTEDMTNKVQELKCKTKTMFHQNMSKYYEEMHYRRQCGYFQFEEDPFSGNVQCIGKIMHEVFLVIKFLD